MDSNTQIDPSNNMKNYNTYSSIECVLKKMEMKSPISGVVWKNNNFFIVIGNNDCQLVRIKPIKLIQTSCNANYYQWKLCKMNNKKLKDEQVNITDYFLLLPFIHCHGKDRNETQIENIYYLLSSNWKELYTDNNKKIRFNIRLS
jgi:hypothetical protein